MTDSLTFYLFGSRSFVGFPGGSVGKESSCNAGDVGSIPGSGRPFKEGVAAHSPLPGESHGQRSLGHKESDTTEAT